MSTTIRVSEETRSRFAALAKQTGRPMTQLLDEAADALERDLFFHGLERRYEQLSHDEEAWAQIEDERRAEAGSLRDYSK